jgi:Holliday junction DNA helicase RuvB
VREGFLMRTPRGRVATPAAWAHLRLTPPRDPASGAAPGPAGGAPDPDLFA